MRREDYRVEIPAGKFLMGAQSENPEGANYDPESTYTDEQRETPREVYLDAYGIGRYPVTVGQYRLFVEDDGCQGERWWTAGAGDGGTKVSLGQRTYRRATGKLRWRSRLSDAGRHLSAGQHAREDLRSGGQCLGVV
jgi:formylglycine-generating enzyme required for sulfatase activity